MPFRVRLRARKQDDFGACLRVAPALSHKQITTRHWPSNQIVFGRGTGARQRGQCSLLPEAISPSSLCVLFQSEILGAIYAEHARPETCQRDSSTVSFLETKKAAWPAAQSYCCLRSSRFFFSFSVDLMHLPVSKFGIELSGLFKTKSTNQSF